MLEELTPREAMNDLMIEVSKELLPIVEKLESLLLILSLWLLTEGE